MIKNFKKILLKESTTIKKAARMMDEAGAKIVLVCSSSGKLEGVLSFGDLRRSLLEGHADSDKIKDIYNRRPITANKGDNDRRIKALSLSKLSTTGGIIQVPILDKHRRPIDVAIIDTDGKLSYLTTLAKSTEKRVEKILVTGGAGYLGSVLVRKLLNSGYKVKVLDNLSFGKESLSKIWAHKGFDLVVGDVLHIDEVVEAAKDVDAVVHLAAIVGDEASSANPTLAISDNTLATINLAHTCKKFQINRLVFTSTCSVYGASESENLLAETSPLIPVSLYAQSKIESEIELLRLSDQNFSPTVLRLSTLFGWSHRPRFDLVVNFFTLLASQGKGIPVNGGDQWRPFLHVRDAARAIEMVLQSPIKSISGEIFNVGSNNSNFTINEIAETIKKLSKDVVIKNLNSVGDKRNYRVSFSKINRVLDFHTEIGIEEGILEMNRNIKKSDINNLKKMAFNSPGLLSSLQ
ncbi:MAG: NAD-dependent epimerase/dehydratase family protein [Patescibacteria group bacterium]